MKVSREQASQNRERVLATASQLFRERGFAGIGVADIMKAAGLTHGGFYGQFASKEELMAEACARALAESLDTWTGIAQGTAKDPLATVTDGYLSTTHRDSPGHGCVTAALGAEVARQGHVTRAAVTAGIKGFFNLFAGLVPGRSQAVREERAMVAFSTMVGALVLARAVDDDALSRRILTSAASAVKG